MKEKTTILLIEDNFEIVQKLREELEETSQNQMIVKYIEKFSNIKEQANALQPDLILLDYYLPNINGDILLEQLKILDIPIIVLTSEGSITTEINFLNNGAVDFIRKPYKIDVLRARIQRILNLQINNNDISSYKTLNLNHNTAKLNDEIKLSMNEYKILKALISAQGEILTKEDLMLVLWNDKIFIEENTLIVAINRLRKKMINCKTQVVTIRGEGFKLQ